MSPPKKKELLTRQTVVRLDPDLHDWLREISEEEGRTVAQTIRHYLRQAKRMSA